MCVAQVQLGGVIGKGSFGCIYSGWRGSQPIAVKVRPPPPLFQHPPYSPREGQTHLSIRTHHASEISSVPTLAQAFKRENN